MTTSNQATTQPPTPATSEMANGFGASFIVTLLVGFAIVFGIKFLIAKLFKKPQPQPKRNHRR